MQSVKTAPAKQINGPSRLKDKVVELIQILTNNVDDHAWKHDIVRVVRSVERVAQ